MVARGLLKGNRGEWGEAYAFCQLLGSGIVIPTDDGLRVDKTKRLLVISLARHETSNCTMTYMLNKSEATVSVSRNGTFERMVPQTDFAEHADVIFDAIKTKGGRTFSIPEVEGFLRMVGCNKLKPSDTDKPDIFLEVYDPLTASTQSMKYSVKCMAGARPSFVNSSGLTYFHYELEGLTERNFEDIESIPHGRVKQRVEMCRDRSSNVTYRRLSYNAETFRTNLTRVHPYAEATLGYLILESYSVRGKRCKTVLDRVKHNNPLGLPDSSLYEIAFKQYLWAAFCGMVPSVDWRHEDTVDGFLLVDVVGDVLSYPIVKRMAFEEHLIDSTYFDTPSTASNRITCHTGDLYEEDGHYFLQLNLLIKYDANEAQRITGLRFAASHDMDEKPAADIGLRDDSGNRVSGANDADGNVIYFGYR